MENIIHLHLQDNSVLELENNWDVPEVLHHYLDDIVDVSCIDKKYQAELQSFLKELADV